jgi:hypothetical protein
MVLLRQRFFKSCAFRTRLQDWFKDNKITKVEQLNGYTKAQKITDIKLVFTESSLKYIKMAKANKSKDYNTEFKNACDAWLNQMGNKVELGLVKTDKDTHHLEGRMVRTNYQMLNTLGLSNVEVKEFLNDSIDYLKNIKLHPIYLRHYINYAIDNEEHDIDTLNYRINSILSMMNRSNLFTKTKIYSNFQKDITDSFKKELRLGKVLVDGTYATIFGNPSEFLKATITKDYHKDDNDDPISLYGEEIYCSRFPEGQLLCCRSPHVTMGNLMLGENMSSFKHSEYFELSPNIVCVNAIKNNIQQKLNGCDYDSDTMLITDNPILLKALKRQKDDFLVPVYSAKPGKKNGETAKVESVQSEIEAIIKLDTNISKNKVGEIINLSQLLNSVYWHRLHQFENDSTMTSSDTKNKLNPLYQDICKLAVLSGLEIDKAKRSYNADAQKELNSIKSKYNLGETPNFLKYLSSKGTESTQNEEKYDTAMYHINKCFAHYNEKPNENGDIKYTAFKLPSCTYDTYLCELVNLPDTENERNNKNNKKYMEEILSIVKAANDELSSIRKRKRLKMDSENDDEKIQKCIEKCFIDVQDKIKNQTIVYKLLEKIDEEYKKSDKQKYLDDENIEENDGDDDTKYNVRSFSSLLFAAILYENVNNTKNVNHFFNMVKVEDFKRENLVLSEEKLTDDTIYNYHFVRQNVDSYLN